MGSLNWASGLIPLGHLHLRPSQRHFHSLGLTNRFSPLRHSDPLVLATLLRQWQDLSFLTSGILSDLSRSSPFSQTPRARAGPPTCGILRLQVYEPLRNVNSTLMCWSSIGPPSLVYSITGPSCFDRYRQYHCCTQSTTRIFPSSCLQFWSLEHWR